MDLKPFAPSRRKLVIAAVVVLVPAVLLIEWSANYYRLSGPGLIERCFRIVAVTILNYTGEKDRTEAERLAKSCWMGTDRYLGKNIRKSWRSAADSMEILTIQPVYDYEKLYERIVFVYEKMNAPNLVELKNRFNIERFMNVENGEYESMLTLAAWIGTRWDHGTDPVPGGNKYFLAADLIEKGMQGAGFKCDTAARLTVQAAASLGIPARMVAASKNGYKYNHGVAEVWSNQYNKWFLLDTDFNAVFENHDKIPLSAYELCHMEAPHDKRAFEIVQFAPPKPSGNDIRQVNILDLFQYIHIDLRNDWFTRRLDKGSPASGDLATWWTARRSKDSEQPLRVLTSKIRVDDKSLFDWPVNFSNIHLAGFQKNDGKIRLDLALTGYAPYFDNFEIRVDQKTWISLPSGQHLYHLTIEEGLHTLESRIRTKNGFSGPVFKIVFKCR